MFIRDQYLSLCSPFPPGKPRGTRRLLGKLFLVCSCRSRVVQWDYLYRLDDAHAQGVVEESGPIVDTQL